MSEAANNNLPTPVPGDDKTTSSNAKLQGQREEMQMEQGSKPLLEQTATQIHFNFG
jgi:hypothetical protein